MENRRPESFHDNSRSHTASPTAEPRHSSPSAQELTSALSRLSLPSERSTPISTPPPSSRLSAACPTTPTERTKASAPPPLPVHESTPTPERVPFPPVHYPDFNDFESSPEPSRSESPTPSSPHHHSLSTETTPEPVPPAKSKTLVIVHDACHKHKFSRNVKARELASIVERPERCRASILGIAAAKSRLEIESLTDHAFDIIKSTRLGNLTDAAVTDVHGANWPNELSSLCNDAFSKVSNGELEIPDPYHSGDLYLGPDSSEALRGCVGSVYDAVDSVLAGAYDRVHVSVRPPGHHCGESMPSGFCLINNVHIAIAYARRAYGITRAAILDFDLHHGDGSQAIAWAINDKTDQLERLSRSPRHHSISPSLRVGYFSLHDIYSFPCEEGLITKIQEASLCLNAHGQAIWNVHLRHHTTPSSFDAVYDEEYSFLFKRAGEFLSGANANDKCMVFLSAGFDGSEHESKAMQRHGYNLPTHFYQRFASDSIQLANTYASGKILSVLEGGYADRAITSGSYAFMIGLSGVTEQSVNHRSLEWWSLPRLTLLEKWAKKPQAAKVSNSDPDIQWAAQLCCIAASYLPTPVSFPAESSGVDASLLATPRVGLRERKKPAVPATAPPTVTKTRRQRVATPRARKSMTATEAFVQADNAPPVPETLRREDSPGTGLTSLLQNMSIKNDDQENCEVKARKWPESLPGTPTPSRKTGLNDMDQ